MRWPEDHKRKRIASYQSNDETTGYLRTLAQPGEYSQFIRDMIKERWVQENLPGCRAAVVRLMQEYESANGIEGATRA
jgi:hypothetical protein